MRDVGLNIGSWLVWSEAFAMCEHRPTGAAHRRMRMVCAGAGIPVSCLFWRCYRHEVPDQPSRERCLCMFAWRPLRGLPGNTEPVGAFTRLTYQELTEFSDPIGNQRHACISDAPCDRVCSAVYQPERNSTTRYTRAQRHSATTAYFDQRHT